MLSEHEQLEALLNTVIQKENEIMSAITDFAAKEKVSLAGIASTLDSIAAGVAALDVLIQNFQNSTGTLSAADQTALDEISAASTALATKATAIVVTPPVAGA